jgi:hypothetical protein
VNLFRAAFDVFPSLAPKYLRKLDQVLTEGTGRQMVARHAIPLKPWLSLFDAVLADIGPNALFKIGTAIIANPYLPATPNELEARLRYIDVAFHMSHRKAGQPMYAPNTGKMIEGIGHFAVERVEGRKKFLIRCDTPYPCSLEHGILNGIALQVEPRAVVAHDQPDVCRTKGGRSCTYSVSW